MKFAKKPIVKKDHVPEDTLNFINNLKDMETASLEHIADLLIVKRIILKKIGIVRNC